MSDFMDAINDLVKEKGITKDVIMEAIESALVSAYKKNYGTAANVRVEMNEETGDVEVLMQKDVVEEVEDDATQIIDCVHKITHFLFLVSLIYLQ